MRALSFRRRWLITVVGVMLLIILVPATALAQFFWQDNILIENNSGHDALLPQVAMSGSNVVAVWSQWDGSANRIYSNHSSDSGATWHNSLMIDNSDGKDAIHPQVAIWEQNVAVVWQQSDGHHFRIYASYSSDGGATWRSPRLIENNQGYDGSRPQVSLSGSNIAVVWSQSDGSSDRVYGNASLDGGLTWQGVKIISSAGHNGYLPRIASFNHNVVVIWNQDYGAQEKVYASHSMDGGAHWQKPIALEEKGGNSTVPPSLAVFGQSAVAVWSHETDSLTRVYSNYSGNGATTWHKASLIDDAAFGGIAPVVSVSGSWVVALWQSQSWIGANYSTDDGASWHTARLFDNPDGRKGYNPAIALFGHNAVAVWETFDAKGDGVISSYSKDGGKTWSQPEKIKGLSEHGGFVPGCKPRAAIHDLDTVAVWTQRYADGHARVYSSRGTFMKSDLLYAPGFTSWGVFLFVLLMGGSIVFFLLRVRPAHKN